MHIEGAVWTPKVNMLAVVCDCGHVFMARADRWLVVCPRCRKKESISTLRSGYRKP